MNERHTHTRAFPLKIRLLANLPSLPSNLMAIYDWVWLKNVTCGSPSLLIASSHTQLSLHNHDEDDWKEEEELNEWIIWPSFWDCERGVAILASQQIQWNLYLALLWENRPRLVSVQNWAGNSLNWICAHSARQQHHPSTFHPFYFRLCGFVTQELGVSFQRKEREKPPPSPRRGSGWDGWMAYFSCINLTHRPISL